jgi:hypothetical protein
MVGVGMFTVVPGRSSTTVQLPLKATIDVAFDEVFALDERRRPVWG